ncbi:MAG: winged helix-turn-helix transcriptional regulator [bacterium]
MDRELRFLMLIENDERITQRELSRETGLALGTINNIIQRMLNDGWLDKQQSSKGIKYSLTKKGVLKKNELLYINLEDGYSLINKFKKEVKLGLSEYLNKNVNTFYIYGKEDVISKLLIMCLIELKRQYKLSYILAKDYHTVKKGKNSIWIVWQDNFADVLKLKGLNYFKLL